MKSILGDPRDARLQSATQFISSSARSLLLRGIACGVLLTIAATSALASTTESDLAMQRLGVSAASVQSLRLDSPDLTVPIELDGQRVTLVLERSSLRRPGFRVLVETANGSYRDAVPPPASTYRGSVAEIPGSIVGGTIRNGMLNAAVALGDGRLFYIQPMAAVEPGSSPDRHVIYQSTDAVGGEGTCATDEPQVVVTPGDAGIQSTAALRVAELAFDADFEFFTMNGSSVDATVDDIEDVMSAVNVVYRRDCDLVHALTTIIVRSTSSDPYSSTGASQLLSQFRTHWNASQTTVTRDVAHLMTGKNLDGGTIGIASVGVVCNRSSAYGLSQSRFSTNMASRCALTAHEIGHNWNANHCDAASQCNIMCSSLGGCDGLGLPNFEPMSITAINSFSASRSCLTSAVAVSESRAQADIRLASPVPSPFTGETVMAYHLEHEASADLDVYDVAGHRVARLAQGQHGPGWHQAIWRGQDQSGRGVKPGIYYARLRTGETTLTQRLIFVR